VSYPAITLNLVPMSALSAFGTMAVFEGGARCGDNHVLSPRGLDGLDGRQMPGGADVLQFADAAQPIEFLRVIARARVAEERSMAAPLVNAAMVAPSLSAVV